MSQQSITNKLVASVKQTSQVNNPYIDTEQIVCIDASNNRIGINTSKPQYSITISGNINDTNLAVKAPNLYIDNSAIINNIDTSFILCISGNITHLDVSDTIITQVISGNSGFFTSIVSNIFDIETLDLSFLTCDICANFEHLISNTISCGTISCESITLKKNIDIDQIIVNNLLITDDLSFNDGSGITLDLVNLNVSNNVTISGSLSVSGNTILNNLDVSGDTSLNNLNVDGSAIFTEISTNFLFIEEVKMMF